MQWQKSSGFAGTGVKEEVLECYLGKENKYIIPQMKTNANL